METFSIREVLENKLKSLKSNNYDNPLYRKTCILYDIWLKNKELLYLLDLYKVYEENKVVELDDVTTYDPSGTYKEQYISFLMKTDMIFIEEVEDDNTLITLIFYWLLREVKIDLNKIKEF